MFYSIGPYYNNHKKAEPKKVISPPQKPLGGLMFQIGPFYDAQAKASERADETRCGIFCTGCKDFIDYAEPNEDGSAFVCCWCEVTIEF